MMTSERTYLPGAGADWLLPIYDPLTKLLGMDKLRLSLLDQAALESSFRVLDIGCGTGTLAVLIKRLYPRVEVVGLDPDPKALARAQRKADRAAVSVRFDRGYSNALGYADATFDRVFSSMMLHHVPKEEREQTLREIRRVLKPGGRLELLDFTTAHFSAHAALAHLFHAHSRLSGNTENRILDLLALSGFAQARKVSDRGTLFGSVAFFQASAPPVAAAT